MNISAIPLLVLFISCMPKSITNGSQAATPYATTYWIAPAASVYGSSYVKYPNTVAFQNPLHETIYGTTYDLTPTSGSASGAKVYATSYWTQPSANSGSEQSIPAPYSKLYATSYWTQPLSGYGALHAAPAFNLYATSYYRQPSILSEYIRGIQTFQSATSHEPSFKSPNTLPVNDNKDSLAPAVTGQGLQPTSTKESTEKLPVSEKLGAAQKPIQDAITDEAKQGPSQTTKGNIKPLETAEPSTGYRPNENTDKAATGSVDKSATGNGRMQDTGNSATGQGSNKSSTGHKKAQRTDGASTRNATNKKKSKKTRIVRVVKRIKRPLKGSGKTQGAKRVASGNRTVQETGKTSSKSGTAQTTTKKTQASLVNSQIQSESVPAS